ncbi:hypothetical protein P22_0341 [Propionispora sp. 2/2-37]|uniref:YggS family pyridoxal phosphate-dependent enzyme n=1 Tax=Propionispora sp. 2/2-37 TaxID=1677858 RepID=UPI0006BB5AC4|nr:YggS family pyridoxal phosphate-dependent enzyme [Propionispora sp. 2/2-37]CUH94275.1 hypothetical protein P22_0341 [Propionispora sp. 2/2-37]
MSIQDNLEQIRKNIGVAFAKRKAKHLLMPADVKLLAVTKNQDVTSIQEAIRQGITAIGENRVQEAHQKYQQLTNIEWHLIGHLQTNKVKQALQIFDLIHSVDSERLSVEINRIAENMNKLQDVLIQVNVAGEESKYGITPQEVIPLAKLISNLANVRLCGLMTIAPYYEDVEQVRPICKEMYRLFRELREYGLPRTRIEWLSMGMTNDYSVAIEEGANIVRIGTGIFGKREYK